MTDLKSKIRRRKPLDQSAFSALFSRDFRTFITVKLGHLLGAAAYASIIKYVYRGFG